MNLKSHYEPFCHHEGPCKRWEFLNRCNFRFRSTPSSLFPTHKIGFGAAGCFSTFVGIFRHVFFVFRVFCPGGRHKSWKNNFALRRPLGSRALALRAQGQP